MKKIFKFLLKALNFIFDNLDKLTYFLILYIWLFKPKFFYSFHPYDIAMFVLILILGMLYDIRSDLKGFKKKN